MAPAATMAGADAPGAYLGRSAWRTSLKMVLARTRQMDVPIYWAKERRETAMARSPGPRAAWMARMG